MDAIQNGAKIINLSLGFDNDDTGEMDSLINIALRNNVLVVAAAGNEQTRVKGTSKNKFFTFW